MEILDVHNRPIDPIWAAEFRGFLWADGSLEIGQYSRKRGGKRHNYFRIRARIVQRDDNRAILEAIQSRLGGQVTRHNSRIVRGEPNGPCYIMHPTVAWQVTSTADLRRVISVLRNGVLPYTKQRLLDVMEEFLDKRHARGYTYSPEEREGLQALQDKMRALQEYVKS